MLQLAILFHQRNIKTRSEDEGLMGNIEQESKFFFANDWKVNFSRLLTSHLVWWLQCVRIIPQMPEKKLQIQIMNHQKEISPIYFRFSATGPGRCALKLYSFFSIHFSSDIKCG